MRARNGFVLSVPLGAAVGLASSLTNATTLPGARFASYVLNAGWTWAAVAVAAGWLVAGRVGGLAGVVALATTTTTYYCADSMLRQESLGSYWPEMYRWWGASVVLGSVLGLVGAGIRRGGRMGRLAALVVPAGAAVEMAWLPRWSGDLDPVLHWARIAVWAAAALAVVVVLTAPLRGRQRDSTSTTWHATGGLRPTGGVSAHLTGRGGSPAVAEQE